MKKILILLIFFTSFSYLYTHATELESGKWNFFLEEDYCYIGSFPTKKDLPEGKKRGDTYILVYRINKNPDAIVQIDAGYPYDEEKIVEVTIDKKIYDFYSKDDTAWTKKDTDVIFAMKKGVTLTVTGYSSRGTKTKDTYTLSGFTKAYNKLSKGC